MVVGFGYYVVVLLLSVVFGRWLGCWVAWFVDLLFGVVGLLCGWILLWKMRCGHGVYWIVGDSCVRC